MQIGAEQIRALERDDLTCLRFFGTNAHYEPRPGPAGPYYTDLRGSMRPGDPFRHPRFLELR